MVCPYCKTDLPEPQTRFCPGCGLANGGYRPPRRPATPAPVIVRCGECGLPGESRRCRGCGNAIRWPSGVVPPGE